ncbi:MAG: biotin transporter BioY [Clostridiales bacterium]|nr:biotin transporter BioY [Clostridiales bacterium]
MVNEEEKRVLTEEVVQKSDRRKEKRSDYSKTRMITYTALLAALLCVLSPWAIPVGPVPISLGLLAVYIVSSLINFKYGAVAVTVFVLLGAFGVPVFTGFTGGFAKVAGPTGGYILGYLPCSLIIGLFVDRFEKRLWVYPLAMLAGTAVLYSFGTVWFVI